MGRVLVVAAVEEDALYAARALAVALNEKLPAHTRVRADVGFLPGALPAMMYYHAEPTRLAVVGWRERAVQVRACVILNVDGGFPFLDSLRKRAAAALGGVRLIETPDLAAGGVVSDELHTEILREWDGVREENDFAEGEAIVGENKTESEEAGTEEKEEEGEDFDMPRMFLDNEDPIPPYVVDAAGGVADVAEWSWHWRPLYEGAAALAADEEEADDFFVLEALKGLAAPADALKGLVAPVAVDSEEASDNRQAEGVGAVGALGGTGEAGGGIFVLPKVFLNNADPIPPYVADAARDVADVAEWSWHWQPLYEGAAALTAAEESAADFFVLEALKGLATPMRDSDGERLARMGEEGEAIDFSNVTAVDLFADECEEEDEEGEEGEEEKTPLPREALTAGVDLEWVAELLNCPLPDMYNKWREMLPDGLLAPSVEGVDAAQSRGQIAALLAGADVTQSEVGYRLAGVCLLLRAHRSRTAQESGEADLRQAVSVMSAGDEVMAPLRYLALLMMMEEAMARDIVAAYNVLVDFLEQYQKEGVAERYPLLFGLLLRVLVVVLDRRGQHADKASSIAELERVTRRLSPEEREAIGVDLFVRMRKLRVKMENVI